MAEAPPSSTFNAALVTAIATVVAALFGLAGGFVAAWFAFVSKDKSFAFIWSRSP
jgi:ABC-type glycerol-3-phosphate transport system permease component